jgi:hypothetical protein
MCNADKVALVLVMAGEAVVPGLLLWCWLGG